MQCSCSTHHSQINPKIFRTSGIFEPLYPASHEGPPGPTKGPVAAIDDRPRVGFGCRWHTTGALLSLSRSSPQRAVVAVGGEGASQLGFHLGDAGGAHHQISGELVLLSRAMSRGEETQRGPGLGTHGRFLVGKIPDGSANSVGGIGRCRTQSSALAST